MEPRHIAPDWYQETFDALYPLLYSHRNVEAARAEAAFAAERLRLRGGEVVLDLCCGMGRHMVHLLRYSPLIVGLDFSPRQLSVARDQVGERAALVRADMRAIPIMGACDAVVNFFTSFGYFLSKEENERAVREIACALKSGGRFLIDYLNQVHVERTLVPHSVRECHGYEIREERWIDAKLGRINKYTSVCQAGKEVTHLTESVQLYAPSDFCDMLSSAGLKVDSMFGDYTGVPLDDSQPRMIVVGHKA